MKIQRWRFKILKKQKVTDGQTHGRCLAYMNMFARFDENPAMTLQDIKKTKRYGRTDAHMDGQRENSIPHPKQSLRGYNIYGIIHFVFLRVTDLRVEISKLCCISVLKICFYLCKQRWPKWNATSCGIPFGPALFAKIFHISSGCSLFTKVPVYQYQEWKGLTVNLTLKSFYHIG